ARVRDQVERDYLARYDGIHTVQRAQEVGSIDEIVDSTELRPWIIRKLTEGRERYLDWIQRRADAVVHSLVHYFSDQGEMGMELWKGMVYAAGLGPHLSALRVMADKTFSSDSGTNGNGSSHVKAGTASIKPSDHPSTRDV